MHSMHAGNCLRPLLPAAGTAQGWAPGQPPQQRSLLVVGATRPKPGRSAGGPPPEPTPSDPAAASAAQEIKKLRLPKTGYLALANPKETVYTKGTEPFDPTKRGGRWKSDFIWNTNWQQQLEMEESLKRQAEREEEEAAAKTGGGFLSFSRVAELNSMDVDMSSRLSGMRQGVTESTGTSTSTSTSKTTVGMTTRGDAKKFEKSNRIAARSSLAPSTFGVEDQQRRELEAQEENVRYEAMKQEFMLWTLGFTALGCTATYTAYSPEIAVSYLVGAVGGFVYLRLLGKTVDSFGGQEGEQGLGAIAGQPRLLVPVVLALVFNRWNLMYADDYGIKLNLLGMLVGFFTYKIAVIARQGKEMLDSNSGSK